MGRGIYFISTHFLFSYFEFRSRATQEQKLLVGGERGEKASAADRDFGVPILSDPQHQKKEMLYLHILWKWKGKNVKEFLCFSYTFFLWPCDHYPFPFPGTIKKKYPRTPVLRRWFFSICAACEWNETLCIPNFSRCFSGSIYSLGCSVIPWTLLW